MVSLKQLESVERRLEEVEEDVTSLYSQFCLLHEFMKHKFEAEFNEFAQQYVIHGNQSQFGSGGTGSLGAVPSTQQFGMSKCDGEQGKNCNDDEVRGLCSTKMMDAPAVIPSMIRSQETTPVKPKANDIAIPITHEEDVIELLTSSSNKTTKVGFKTSGEKNYVNNNDEEIVITNVWSLCTDYGKDAQEIHSDTPTLHRQDWKSKVELGQLSVIKEVSTVGVNPSTKNDSPEVKEASKPETNKRRTKRKSATGPRKYYNYNNEFIFDKEDIGLAKPSTSGGVDSRRKRKSKSNSDSSNAETSAASTPAVKKHQCVFCGKKFRMHSHLVEHVRIHTNEKPFHCLYCEKQFRQASGLRVHERSAHRTLRFSGSSILGGTEEGSQGCS